MVLQSFVTDQMGGPGNASKTSKHVLVAVLLKICLAVFLSNLALCAGAIRADHLSSEGRAADTLALPMDMIAGNPGGMHEQGDDGTKSEEIKSSLNEEQGFDCNYHSDLQYKQESSYPPTGPPVFRVTFTNTCLDQAFSNIHIACGDFSSAALVDPALFRRLAVNDCLLNNGAPLAPQNIIAFEYFSNFAYPMAVFRADIDSSHM